MEDTIITGRDLIRKIPYVLGKIPRVRRGVRFARRKKSHLGLGWAIEHATQMNPSGKAILFDDLCLNYRDFNGWCNRYAHYFAANGITKGDVVGIYLTNRPELLAITGGLAKIGAISALLNTSQRKKILIHSISLVKPKMCVVGEELIDAFEEVRADISNQAIETLYVAKGNTLEDTGSAPEGYTNLAEDIIEFDNSDPKTTSTLTAEDVCFYIYTSGTTGYPKAAVLGHGRWMHLYGSLGLATTKISASDIIYVTLPFYHGTAMVACWATALANGAALAIRDKFSVSEFWPDVRRYQATCFGYVGELCRYLYNQPEHPEEKNNTITKIVGNGLRPDIWVPFKERFGIDEVYELYGASEGNIGFGNWFNLDNTIGIAPTPWALVEYDKDSEKPILNKNGFAQKVPKGQPGLLLGKITKRTPFEGYTDKQKSEQCLLADVFKKGDVYFNTGDVLKSIGMGHTQFVDRLGDTFRWKGENVSTTELEHTINSLDAVEESVAYGVEIPNTNGRAGMVSIRLSKEEQSTNFKDLCSHLKNVLPNYAVPVFLRVQTEMTTTGTFKYKKSDLKSDGYDISKIQDTIYVLLPNAEEYVPITEDLKEDINRGQYRF
ncbi:MAG: long-chain-acyl-CoA synthetase [Gammaproteobacteria bacterium]|nr:MAG: long-chain-acyl-CoA synthetase [Gammaproteobacteria bacterium]